MFRISDALTPASCGHLQASTSKVTVGGRPVCRVGIDTAGSLILGPGNPKVLVEGFPISLENDLVQPHGSSPHSSARTKSSNFTVTVG